MYNLGNEIVMMSRRRRGSPPIPVTAGFAADRGHGVVYAMVGGAGRQSLVRVGFECRPLPVLCGRDVTYDAVDALLDELLQRGLERVEIRIDDEHLLADLAERRAVPNPLIVPYVRLRCKLNRFAAATVVRTSGAAVRDLSARARAEASLDIAA
jgi:hypothetical protein